MKDVQDRVAFITGGSSGIGLGIAHACADAGMKVAIGYRSKDHLAEALNDLKSAGDRVYAVSVDVTDRPGLEQAAADTAKHFGKVHLVVANAGVQNPVSMANMSYEDWDKLIRINLDGVFNTVKAFLPHIRAHGEGGQVVATASIVGLFTVGRDYTAYCASKFAVVAMMESLRVDLADAGIGVSALCPGVVKSNLEKGLKDIAYAADPLEIGQLVLRGVRRNDLYILTHPEMSPVISARSEALVGSSPPDVRPSAERLSAAKELLKNSLYVAELDRLNCVPFSKA